MAIPDDIMNGASASKLVSLVQQSQEHRIKVAQRFDDLYEHLVTGGRADEYTALCDRFKARFDAIADNLERVAARLSSEPVLANMVKAVNAEETRRLELQLELQVIRQRHSVAEAESEEALGGKHRVQTLEAAIGKLTAKIYEQLEELRCEAADLED